MHSSGYLEQFLYLLVYTSSIICGVAVVVFRKRLTKPADRDLRVLIIAMAFSSTMMSIQIFLNAIGLLQLVTENNSSVIIIIINLLITAGIAALVYASTAINFALRPAAAAKIIKNIASVLIASILINTAGLQIMTLFLHSMPAAELLGMIMIGGIVLFLSAMVYSTIRLFIPLHTREDDPALPKIRIVILSLSAAPILFLLSGSLVGTLLAPIIYITLNVLGLRALYAKIQNPQNKVPTEFAADFPGPNLLENCRELGLSKRESDVAVLLASGKSYKEIAAELFISMSTTQTHVGRIYSKLRINNKTELSNLLYYKKD